MCRNDDRPNVADIDRLTDYAKVKLVAECVRLDDSHQQREIMKQIKRSCKSEKERFEDHIYETATGKPKPNILQLADHFYSSKGEMRPASEKYIESCKVDNLEGSSLMVCLANALYRAINQEDTLNEAVYYGIHNVVNRGVSDISVKICKIYDNLLGK